MDIKKLNDRISVSGQPSRDDIKKLSDDGFKAVINLRCAGEEEQPLSPRDEGEVVREAGMEYRNLPVNPEDLHPRHVDRFRGLLKQVATPVLVHCKTGKRAGAFTMMHFAVENGESGEDVLEKAEKMGFECDEPELERFVKRYVDKNSLVESR